MQDAFFTDFSAGQLSRKFQGRFDSEIYSKGVQKIKNLVPLIPAGATLRPGTRYVGAPVAAPNLFTWIISPTIVYLLEFTTSAIRFWRDNVYRGAIILSPAISDADLASIHLVPYQTFLFLTTGTRTWAPKVIRYTAADTWSFGDVAFIGNTGAVPFGSAGNYPARIGMHEGRIHYGNTANEPNRGWASRPGIFYYDPWKGTTSDEDVEYAVGDYITAVDRTKRVVFRCTTAGIAGSTEPTWPGSGTVADGTVVWTYYAAYLVDLTEYDEITETQDLERVAALAFSGDTTSGAQTISNISAKLVKKMKVGDRVIGSELVPIRAALASSSSYSYDEKYSTGGWWIFQNYAYKHLGATTAGSNVIQGLSSDITSQLYVGERVSGDNIPVSIITAIGTNSITINHNATTTDDAISINFGAIVSYIHSIPSATSITFRSYSVLGDEDALYLPALGAKATKSAGSFYSGWHDPLIPETEPDTETRKQVSADNAYSYALASDQNDEIQWFASTRVQIVGTMTGERIVPPGTTALNPSCPRHTGYGSADLDPIVIGESVLFIDAARTAVREYVYTEETGGFSPPLSWTTDIFTAQIVKMDYQTSPVPIAWFLLSTGVLVGCVLAKSIGITAWFTVETTGTIESIAVLPVAGVDTLYLATLRNGVRCIERMLPLETAGEHLDASVVGTVAAGAVSGLTHLAGQAVRVYYSGAVYDLTVSGAGVATIPAAIPNGSSVLIGYGFTGVIGTMAPNPYGDGQIQAQKQKIAYSFYTRVLDSYAFDAAPSETGAHNRAQLPPGETAPYSGDIKVPLLSNHNSDGSVWILQPDPFDTTILAITAQVDTGGR
jgi:hypothetical protein